MFKENLTQLGGIQHGLLADAVQAEAVLQALKQNYSVYAPKRFPKQAATRIRMSSSTRK